METRLIQRCQSGDTQAFEEIFRRYRDDVFRFACAVLHDPPLAQDVTQEVFIKVFLFIGSFQFRSSFRSWLYRVTTNEAMTVLRRRRGPEVASPVAEGAGPDPVAVPLGDPEAVVLATERAEWVRRAVHSLDPLHRRVITLKYFRHCSDSDIAGILGCPPGTVKSRLYRARAVLRGWLHGEQPGPAVAALQPCRARPIPHADHPHRRPPWHA